jgi:hypothetical protein
LTSSYNSSPYFLYYFEIIENIILARYNFLLDLNMDLLTSFLKMLKMKIQVSYTTDFMPVEGKEGDFRYTINPKKDTSYNATEYFQVFNYVHGFVPGLSIVDLVFNLGPEAIRYL